MMQRLSSFLIILFGFALPAASQESDPFAPARGRPRRGPQEPDPAVRARRARCSRDAHAWAFQRPWEDYFTVVQWDQSAAGKSFPLNDPQALAPTLSLERYRDDAIELMELLVKRYGQSKVLLLGHSWGSAVALSAAAKRPDLLHAYIGMGQMIDWRENERLGIKWTLERVRAQPQLILQPRHWR